jgi:hypothetical protein
MRPAADANADARGLRATAVRPHGCAKSSSGRTVGAHLLIDKDHVLTACDLDHAAPASVRNQASI